MLYQSQLGHTESMGLLPLVSLRLVSESVLYFRNSPTNRPEMATIPIYLFIFLPSSGVRKESWTSGGGSGSVLLVSVWADPPVPVKA